jgi:hypothetical protein
MVLHLASVVLLGKAVSALMEGHGFASGKRRFARQDRGQLFFRGRRKDDPPFHAAGVESHTPMSKIESGSSTRRGRLLSFVISSSVFDSNPDSIGIVFLVHRQDARVTFMIQTPFSPPFLTFAIGPLAAQ